MRSTLARVVWLIAAIAAWLLAAAPAMADAPLVYATIEPARITIGDSATLRITSLGPDMDAFNLPPVQGLQFEVLGHSHQIEFINGTVLASTSVVVRVTAQITGIFKIPPITPKSQPLILEVSPKSGVGSLAQSPNPTSPNKVPALAPPSVANAATLAGIRMTADGSAFVKVDVPKRAVYVGESVPIDIELGVREGFVTALNGLPTLTGSEFTLNNLSGQPERQERMIDGKRFALLTWHSVIAAVKPGEFSLSVDTPLTVKIRTQPRRESALDDMLGDPFLQNFFGATVQKEISVSSPPAELTVVALPTEGRPRDFSGAVGTFKIESGISATTAAAGDPLTLSMHVIGAGNFDRVDSSMLAHLDDWKTYPPTSSFKKGDTVGYKGEKIFEQPLIAAAPGEQTLPGLAFNYFDPVARKYQTARSAPLNVTISPALADAKHVAAPALANAGVPRAGAAHAGAAPDGLRPDHGAEEASSDTLVPLYLQPRFLAVPSILALAFAAGWLGLRRRQQGQAAGAPQRRVASKATRRLLAQLDAAARAGDPVEFFGVARAALQEDLALRWQLAPQQVTTAELQSRLGTDEDDIARLFALADEVKYAGGEPKRTDFDRWTDVVRQTLATAGSS
jgi:hypothetical protein